VFIDGFRNPVGPTFTLAEVALLKKELFASNANGFCGAFQEAVIYYPIVTAAVKSAVQTRCSAN
jgi:hypothetical protein